MKRHHVRVWSDRVDARYGLAELVKRLVEETSEGSVEAEFAIDEGVDIGGFDGTVSAVTGSRWVPSGWSAWELSTRRDVGTKANCRLQETQSGTDGLVGARNRLCSCVTAGLAESGGLGSEADGRGSLA